MACGTLGACRWCCLRGRLPCALLGLSAPSGSTEAPAVRGQYRQPATHGPGQSTAGQLRCDQITLHWSGHMVAGESKASGSRNG